MLEEDIDEGDGVEGQGDGGHGQGYDEVFGVVGGEVGAKGGGFEE